MKTIFKSKLIFLVLLSYSSLAQVYVRGYTKSSGTYVAPHYRSSPNSTPTDNYSYPGNINPYTGKIATGNPDTYLDRYNSTNKNSGTTKYQSSQYSVEDLLESKKRYDVLVKEVERSYEQRNGSSSTLQSNQATATDTYIGSILSSSETPSLPVVPETYYIKQDTWIRKGPSKNHATLQRVYVTEITEVLENYSNGWSKIKFTYLTPKFNFISRVGYVPTSRLTTRLF